MAEPRPVSARLLPVFCLMLYGVVASIGLFSGGLWAAVGIGGAILLYAGLWMLERKKHALPKGFALFVLAALGVLALEVPLSAYPLISLRVWAQLATIFLPLVLLTSPRLQRVALAPSFIVTISLIVCAAALALQLELRSGGFLLHAFKKPGAALTEYNRGIAHIAILVFPLFAGLWGLGKKEEAGLLALTLLFPAGLTESHTAKLALIVGTVCTLCAFYRPGWVHKGLTALSVTLLGWPFYAQFVFLFAYRAVENIHASWRHRIEIWDYLSYRIMERPVFGWGLGTTHMLDFTQPHGMLYTDAVRAAPHAHNFITELWVEAGLPGLGFGLALLLIGLRGASKLHASLRPFAYGSWAAAVTVSLFGFDFWTDALWAAFALTVFAFGMLQQKLESEHNLIDA